MKVQELFSLRDQAALVTGAGAGIGKAISLLFAEAGASVACTDRDGEQAQVVAEECRRFGGKAIGLALDVTDESQRVDVVDQVVRQLGNLSILVNNAGGGGPKPFDMPLADFEWAFQLNVYFLFRLSQLAAPHMKSRGGGAILNISSMAGSNKNKRMCSYGASKAAVDHLTRNMAFDPGLARTLGGLGWRGKM
jgi:7-alpha-hydroxysteroid dehydrogenase